jgi:hypothetical protein
MQPPSADRLYHEIEAATAEDDLESLKAALPRIELFLAHYGDDPRAEQVRGLEDEAKEGNPVQRAFTEAKRYALINPELAAARFQALIDVYDEGAGTPEATRHFVRLARQKLKQLRTEIAQRVADDRKLVESRLARANELTSDDPSGARKIYEGIVTLYGEKPWAADLVGQANEQLAAIAKAQAAAEK